MNDSYFYLFSSLLAPEHTESMGKDSAVWLYLWMVNQAEFQDRQLPDEKRCFEFEWSHTQAAKDLGVTRRTIYAWHATLRTHGYVESTLSRYGFRSRLLGLKTIQQWLTDRKNGDLSPPSGGNDLSHLKTPGGNDLSHLETSGGKSGGKAKAVSSYSPKASQGVEKDEAFAPGGNDLSHLEKRDDADQLRLIWQQTLDALKGTMTQATFNTWFPTTELLSLSETEALILCKTPYQRDWLQNRLADRVARVLGSVLERPVSVYFVMSGDAAG